MSGLQLQLRLEIHIRVNKFRGAVYVDEKRFSSDGKAYAILQACDAEGLVPTWKVYNSKLCQKVPLEQSMQNYHYYKPHQQIGVLCKSVHSIENMSRNINNDRTKQKDRHNPGASTLLYQGYSATGSRSGRKRFLFPCWRASCCVCNVPCYTIGKYIDSSGLDKIFTQSGIYGHLAVNKILARGKI